MSKMMRTELAITCQSKEQFEEYYIAVKKYSSINNIAPPEVNPYYSMTDISRLISSLSPDDCLYLRYPPIPKITLPIIINDGPRIIFEINGILSKEGGNDASIGISWRALERVLGSNIIALSNGVICVTDEIFRHYYSRSRRNKLKGTTVSNGIDCHCLPISHHTSPSEKEIHLIGVALVSNWHGFDRIIRGMAKYEGNKEYYFHIVGRGPEINTLKRIVNDLHISNRVIFHGFQSGEPLDELYNACDVAVSTLAIHRKGLHEHCSLKSREYCTRGIPFLYSGIDPDFPEKFPYAIRFFSNEKAIDMERVAEFYARVKNDPEYSHRMNDYAMKKLDWSIKMKELKTFLYNF